MTREATFRGLLTSSKRLSKKSGFSKSKLRQLVTNKSMREL